MFNVRHQNEVSDVFVAFNFKQFISGISYFTSGDSVINFN